MRITIEIDENDLEAVQKATGQRKKSPALQQAIAEYLRQRRKLAFLKKVREGKTDFSMTNEQLEAMYTYDDD